MSKTRDLGKDEPHPVAILPPSLHFPTHLLVDGHLRVDETFENERVRYLRLLKPRRRSKAAPNSIARASSTLRLA